jgi:hypothetical protein
MGNTWYRVPVSTTSLPSGNDVQIIVQSINGAATYYVDGAYVELGTSTAPKAWMSARAIDNRNDPQSTSAATENYLNYIDVWGIPGDAPALTDFRLTGDSNASGSFDILVASSIADGTTLAANHFHWIESDATEVSYPGSGIGSWTDQTGSTNDHYKQFAATGSGSVTFYYNPSPAQVRIIGDALLEICRAGFFFCAGLIQLTLPFRHLVHWEAILG